MEISTYIPSFTFQQVLLSVVAGLLIAWILYRGKTATSPRMRIFLFSLRFLSIALTVLLLTNPIIRKVTNYTEKPMLVVAIDNSLSIGNHTDAKVIDAFKANLKLLKTELEKLDIGTDFFSFNGKASIDSIAFTNRSTNLELLLRNMSDYYENQLVTGVVLVSDGIYNQGSSPINKSYFYPIHTVGLGDTTPKKDLRIAGIDYNNIAYLGNKFPIKVDISHFGYSGSQALVKVVSSSGLAVQQSLVLAPNGQSITLYPEAKNRGLQHLTIELSPLPGEKTLKNNKRDIYVEVIDGKEKILIVASAPHPDLKALRNAIELEQNFSVSLFIPGLNELKNDKYDLYIFHNAPDGNQVVSNLIAKANTDKTPAFFIVGGNTNLQLFNTQNKIVRILKRPGDADRVFPSWNEDFTRFSLEQSNLSALSKLPPLTVPFAEYFILPGTEILLNQRLGGTVINKPLLAINNEDGHKTAALFGEGLWEWRLQEYAETRKHEATDDLIKKLIQFLSAKDDKRKFRLFAVNQDLVEGEKATLVAECYNDLYEKVFGQTITLSLRDEKGKVSSYSFLNGENAHSIDLSGLKPGIYHFKGGTQIGKRNEVAEGEFLVRELQLEELDFQAKHNMLRELSAATSGRFLKPENVMGLAELYKQNKPKKTIHSIEEENELINERLLFFVIVALLCLEWFLRKRFGTGI